MWILMLAATLALALAACEADDDVAEDDPDDPADAPAEPADEPDEVVELEMLASPSAVAFAVAQDNDLFEGIDLDYTRVGYGEEASLFLAGEVQVGSHSPLEVTEWISQGEDLMWFSTASALNFWNGLVVRAEDADQYQDIPDLVGQTLGQPGFGTGTWLAFESIASAVHGLDASEDFDIVTADPGALLGLLATGEVESSLSFAGQAAAAMASDDMELITSFTQEWQEETGQPLVINGLVAQRSWLEENLDVARRLVEGLDRAVEWIKDNPDEFAEGGQYQEWVEGEGWLGDDATRDHIVSLLQDDQWYFTSDVYTDEWIDAVYLFIEEALEGQEGVDEVPPKEEIFLSPDELR